MGGFGSSGGDDEGLSLGTILSVLHGLTYLTL